MDKSVAVAEMFDAAKIGACDALEFALEHGAGDRLHA